jgi:hypothetical protein
VAVPAGGVMMENDLEELLTVEGAMEAEIVKSKLENFQIPVLLKFESAGHIFGITMDGLGKVKIMVPKALLREAREILAG